jgi:hypothetical protein
MVKLSAIIETGLWSERQCSLHEISEILKANKFEIEDVVDSAEVFGLIRRVESAGQSEK